MSLSENVEHDGFLISADPTRLDLDFIQQVLQNSYWAPSRSRESMERAVANSLCFGLYDARSHRQVGLARVVTDYETFAWLCDVVVDQPYRGRGLGKWLLDVVLSDPQLQPVRRWLLATLDAHGLYQRYGFAPMARPERWMERVYGSTA